MCFIATILRPLRSKRATISPVRPRSNASGFTRIRVRSKSSSWVVAEAETVLTALPVTARRQHFVGLPDPGAREQGYARTIRRERLRCERAGRADEPHRRRVAATDVLEVHVRLPRKLVRELARGVGLPHPPDPRRADLFDHIVE